MAATVALALLGTNASPSRAGDCQAQAKALQTRLTQDGLVLGMNHPDVTSVAGKIQPASLNLPIYRSRIEGTHVEVDRRGRARVAGTQGWLEVPSPELEAAIEKVISSGSRGYIDLDRWQPVVRQAFEAIPIDTGVAVTIDGRAPSARAVNVLRTLAEANHRRIDLIVRLSDPPQIAPGVPHPEGGRPSPDGFWPHWLTPGPSWRADPRIEDGDDPLGLAPWPLRPLIFAELAAEAWQRADCKPEADHVAWWQQGLFPPPGWGVARVRLEREREAHLAVQLPPRAPWSEGLAALVEAAGVKLGPAPKERPAVWFWMASELEVVEDVPRAWRVIPHYVPLTEGRALVERIRTAPHRHVVKPKGEMVIMGSLDKTIIRRLLKQQQEPLRSCLAHALHDGVAIDAEIRAELVVGPDGRVRAAKLAGGSVDHEKTRACLVAALKAIPFPTCCSGIVIIRQSFVVRSEPDPTPGGSP